MAEGPREEKSENDQKDSKSFEKVKQEEESTQKAIRQMEEQKNEKVSVETCKKENEKEQVNTKSDHKKEVSTFESVSLENVLDEKEKEQKVFVDSSTQMESKDEFEHFLFYESNYRLISTDIYSIKLEDLPKLLKEVNEMKQKYQMLSKMINDKKVN